MMLPNVHVCAEQSTSVTHTSHAGALYPSVSPSTPPYILLSPGLMLQLSTHAGFAFVAAPAPWELLLKKWWECIGNWHGRGSDDNDDDDQALSPPPTHPCPPSPLSLCLPLSPFLLNTLYRSLSHWEIISTGSNPNTHCPHTHTGKNTNTHWKKIHTDHTRTHT